MHRLVRALAASCALLLCMFGSMPSTAQPVDSRVTGRWQGSSGAVTASIDLTSGGTLSGTLSGDGLNGCSFDGGIQRIVSGAPTAWVARATVRMTGCDNRSLIQRYDVLVVVARDRLSLDFDGQGRGHHDAFVVAGLTRTGPLFGAGDSITIVDPGIPGHWEGTTDEWTGTLDLTAQGVFSGTVSNFYGQCTFSGSLTTADTNVQGFFSGSGSVSISGCYIAGTHVMYIRNNPTPGKLDMSIWDDAPTGDILDVFGMTRTNRVGASADARESKAGMWSSALGSGWGLSLVTGKTAQRTPFVVLYVYESDKKPTWYVMSKGVWKDDNSFEGDLYATTGTGWRDPGFDTRSVTVKKVGTLLMTFTSDSVGRLTYQIGDGNATYVSSWPMIKQEF